MLELISSLGQEHQPTLRQYLRLSGPLWVRFDARFLDLLLFGGLLGLGIDATHLRVLEIPDLALRLIPFALWIPVEAILLQSFRFTPGKWLFALRVVHRDGTLLSIGQAFKRAISVFVAGCGAGPFIPFTGLWSVWRIANKGETAWDEACATVVIWERHYVRVAIGVTLILGLLSTISVDFLTPVQVQGLLG